MARGRGLGCARQGSGGMKYIGIALVHVWRWTFGLLTPPGTCKFHPSCSQYALDAFREFGLVRGSVLAAWRVVRCNPWSHGGVDYAHDQSVFPLLKSRKADA